MSTNRLKAAKQPTWDLSDLYKSPSDPAITRQLKNSRMRAIKFESKYRGRLGSVVKSPAKMASIFAEIEKISEDLGKPLIYASLLFAACASDPVRGAFLQRMKSEVNQLEKHLLFFELELLGLGRKKLETLRKNSKLGRYKNYLLRLIKSEPHRLVEGEEKLVREKDLTGRGAFTRLFDEEFSHARFEVSRNGKLEELSESETLDLLHHSDQKIRQAGARGLSKGLRNNSRRLLYIFNVLAEDKSIEDRQRKFKTSEDSRHLANEIDRTMVDAMVDAVTANYATVRRYYRFKTKILKLPKLHDYDRYAPLPGIKEKIPYSRAKDLVIDSFSNFAPQYGEIAKKFFDKNWIDAADRPGKRSGAFCSFVTSDLHPYVFINYSGSPRDVSTLAHELGHGIHAYLMRESGYINFDVPLTVAETASVFSEMLLFRHLRESLSSETARFSLTLSKIEEIFATVFRQVSMFKFERDFHLRRKTEGELSIKGANSIWRKRQQEMFGSAIVLTEDYDYWWSYIPHFLHTPFYVYAYAFGELLTLSLYARYERGLPNFVAKYFSMLSSGDSKSPEELVRPFGINLKSRAFWREGLKLIDGLVDEAMKSWKEL